MTVLPSTSEDAASQVPALLLLQQLGYAYLPPQQVLQERGQRLAEVLLPERLRAWLKAHNRFTYRGKQYEFSEDAISAAIEALRRPSLEKGYLATNQEIYDRLTLGFTVEQTILDDKKSYTIQYLNWNPDEVDRNEFVVTEELSVLRTVRASADEDEEDPTTYRPDVVLYVNGIPLAVIECKAPGIKNPIQQAISQHLRQQQPEAIRPLYLYAQLLLAVAGDSDSDQSEGRHAPRYGTTATPAELWAAWRDRPEDDLRHAAARRAGWQQLKTDSINQPSGYRKLHENPRRRALAMPAEASEPTLTVQDVLLSAVCQPARLLDIIRNFIVFDGGQKIVARYQQFYGVHETVHRALQGQGGVLWHSQGSGKSLTMVMLAQMLAARIPTAKIILVTDRVELDDQIYSTFRRCGREVVAASTGTTLARLLQDEHSTDIVATLIHKFTAAVKVLERENTPLNRPNVFVLVDEGHRSQYGRLHARMKQALPTAAFVGFTGTPLTKAEKDTAREFGGLIHRYTITDAEKDGTVLPILYEGRMPDFSTNDGPLNNYFKRLVAHLPEEQQATLREKYSQQSRLSHAAQILYAKAYDISLHFEDAWKGSGFKGQLAAPSKLAAIRLKGFLDDIGLVTSEVLISRPDDREGNDDVHDASTDEVQVFWRRMMDRFGTESNYEKSLKDGWRAPSGSPDIIVTVDKLLTGFDNPINVVLYLCRRLREHTLFQAVARVNRCAPNKEYGYVIDYEGVTEELQLALKTFGNPDFAVYEQTDLNEAIRLASLNAAVKDQLPQARAHLQELFQTLSGPPELAAYTSFLSDEALRPLFLERLRAFQRLLHRAMSSAEYLRATPPEIVDGYLRDLAFFQNLRTLVQRRYEVTPDFSQVEPQIQKLLDTHVSASEMLPVIERINIFSPDFPALVVERIEQEHSEEGVAYEIGTQLTRTLTEKLNENSVRYQEFIDRIKAAIAEYRQGRLDAAELLKQVLTVREEFHDHAPATRPAHLHGRPVASAVFDLLTPSLPNVAANDLATWSVQAEAVMFDTVHDAYGTRYVDWQKPGSAILRKLRQALGDQLWELRSLDNKLAESTLDDLERQLESVTIAHYKAN